MSYRSISGWSKHNPYLKPEYVEFEIEVDPTSIAQRLLKIREQVRREIEHDLEVIGEWEGILLESWVESVKTGEEMVRLDGKGEPRRKWYITANPFIYDKLTRFLLHSPRKRRSPNSRSIPPPPWNLRPPPKPLHPTLRLPRPRKLPLKLRLNLPQRILQPSNKLVQRSPKIQPRARFH